MTKGEITRNELFLLLPQCFQLFSITKLLFIEIFLYLFVNYIKAVCYRHVVCVKDYSNLLEAILGLIDSGTLKTLGENSVYVSNISSNSFSAKGNIEAFANNTDSGESARNKLSHLKSALFAF